MERKHTRVQSGLVLDRRGRFLHDGEPMAQPAIELAFHRGLERASDGRYLVRFGRDWAYVTVEDAPYQVSRAVVEGQRVRLDLDNGGSEPLDPDTLALSADGVLYCRIAGGHRARFSWQAQADLASALEEPETGRFALVLEGRRFAIGSETGRPPPRPEDGPPPPDDAGPHGTLPG